MAELGISTLRDVAVTGESLSGGQHPAVVVTRAAVFGSENVDLGEHIPAMLISRGLSRIFEGADGIHIQHPGKCVARVTP